MIVTKKSPSGIDIPLQKIQEQLYDSLLGIWSNIDPSQFISYGRCYKNIGENGYIAENYQENGSYKEVYLDKSVSVISFLGKDDLIERIGVIDKASIHWIFFVNLSAIYGSIEHRADEEVHKDILQVVGQSLYQCEYKSLETGVVNVLKDYPGSIQNRLAIEADIFPWHCFRLNFSLLYDIQDSNCKPFKSF